MPVGRFDTGIVGASMLPGGECSAFERRAEGVFHLRLKHDDRQVGGKAKEDLRRRLVAAFVGETVLPDHLCIREVAGKRAGFVYPGSARCQVDLLDRLRAGLVGVGHGQQPSSGR